MPASNPHRIAVFDIGTVLEAIAAEAGLLFLSDHPIWFIHPETDEQRAFYGDLVIARPVDRNRITADDLLVVIEVVSTDDRRKEIKDTVFQRAVNEYNEVPELGLVYPDAGDSRSLVWYTLDQENGRYQEVSLSPGGELEVAGVPELSLRVKPSSAWEPGRKIEVWYRGELRATLPEERKRAEEEHQRAEEEHQRAEEERKRADRLADKLRAMGIDPNE